MAQQIINVGAAPNDGTGDPDRTAWTKANANFTELYARGGLTAPQGRLTLQTATPVMTTTQAAKTTIFYTPYVGNQVPIYDGTNMVMTTFSELSVATTDTAKNPAAIGASKVNDWFVWSDAGTVRISHGPDWASDTARSAGTALGMVNGIRLNNVSITNGPAAQCGTYVGTTRSNASSQLDWIFGASASGGSAAVFGVWNYYNRVTVSTDVRDTGVAYTYSSATIRQARASAGAQVSFVVGVQEDSVQANYLTEVATAGVSGAACYWSTNLDSVTAHGTTPCRAYSITASGPAFAFSNYAIYFPSIGWHFIAATEQSDGTNANTFANRINLQVLAVTFRG